MSGKKEKDQRFVDADLALEVLCQVMETARVLAAELAEAHVLSHSTAEAVGAAHAAVANDGGPRQDGEDNEGGIEYAVTAGNG